MLTNCFRFAPRDSVPGLIAKICKYLKDHPGWSEEELEEQIKQFVGQTGVVSFNGRAGEVILTDKDVNDLKISSAYFAEGDETIDELDLDELYRQGIRFVFTNWNSATSGYDMSFVLEYFSGSGDVVYYPLASASGGSGNVVSVNGKTGVVNLGLSDVLGDSGKQVKLCTATEFTSTRLATWNAYYKNGYRLVCVLNNESTVVDFLYVLKQDENNHQPIMISSGSGGSDASPVVSVNAMVGAVTIPVVDVSEEDSQDPFAKIFINEGEDYPITPSYDSDRLGGQPPSYYVTYERFTQFDNGLAAVAKTGNYEDLKNKPTIPTVPTALKNPNALTFKGAVSATYDGSAPVEVTIPEGGGGSGNGSSGGSTWDLLINREVAEDCATVDCYKGDNGESFDDYSEILLLIDIHKNSGEFTSTIKVSFDKNVGAWSSVYCLNINGIKADNVYGANMRLYRKTNMGILPTAFYKPQNTSSVSNGLQVSTSNDSNAPALKLPIPANAHITLDVTNLSAQTKFEAVRIGGYQAVIGAGTVIKVWGCRA